MNDVATLALATLLAWLDDGEELAFIDVREEGQYGEGHPLLAVNVPYSTLEHSLPPRVPRRSTRIALYGESPAQGALAARRLAVLGYSQVQVFGAGAAGWAAGGQPLFNGVNVPSKAFAECVEHALHTPAISPAELDRLIHAQADYVLLDSRTVEEYQRFHVPTATAVPSAELLYRFADLVPSPHTLVVVTCAGRTRGIVGAQTLINAGVPNPVRALAGGTQGWRLAGLATTATAPAYFGPLSPAARAVALERGQALAARYAVEQLDSATLATWQADTRRTTYLFDVRTAAEYQAGHREGAVWAPGGQLVQALDHWVATRNARVVLNDTNGVRATSTAHWLKQLGWQVYVLVGVEPGPPAPAAQPAPSDLDPSAALQRVAQGAGLLSAQRSAAYRAGHPAGALWANRSRLSPWLHGWPPGRPLVVYAAEAALAEGIAVDLREAGVQVHTVVASQAAWVAAGGQWQASPLVPADAERIDYLFWLHDRHDGNLPASAAYIAWEEDLPRQVASASPRFEIRP